MDAHEIRQPEVEAPPRVSPAEREAILADMPELKALDPLEDIDGEDTPAEEPKSEETSAGQEDEAPSDESEDADEPGESKEKETEEESGDEPDEETARRIDMVKRQAKRERDKLEERIRDAEEKLERRERTVASKETRLEAYERAVERATIDPAAVLLALGHTPDTLEEAAKSVFDASTKALEDPASRQRAQSSVRERELRQLVEEQRERLDRLESERRQAQEREDLARQANEFLESTAKLANDDTPYVKRWLAEDRGAVIEEFRATALRLIQETGEEPTHADVVRAVEKAEARRAKRYASAGTAPAKTETQQAGERPAAKTLSNDLGTSTPPRTKPKTREEELEDVRLALESGRLD